MTPTEEAATGIPEMARSAVAGHPGDEERGQTAARFRRATAARRTGQQERGGPPMEIPTIV